MSWAWRPQAGPQKALVECALKEIFFGGTRGGGKTDGVLGKWALKEAGGAICGERNHERFNCEPLASSAHSRRQRSQQVQRLLALLGVRSRPRRHISRIRSHGSCHQHRQRCGRME